MTRKTITMSAEEAISLLSTKIADLEDQVTSLRTINSIFRSYLVATGIIDKDQFHQAITALRDGADDLKLSPGAAEQLRKDLDALVVEDDEVGPKLTLIKGGKDD